MWLSRPAATFWVVSQIDWNNWEGIEMHVNCADFVYKAMEELIQVLDLSHEDKVVWQSIVAAFEWCIVDQQLTG